MLPRYTMRAAALYGKACGGVVIGGGMKECAVYNACLRAQTAVAAVAC